MILPPMLLVYSIFLYFPPPTAFTQDLPASAYSAYVGDPCLDKVDPGPCHYYSIHWYWDSRAQQCERFHYGGCLGTRNRFKTKQDCLRKCVYKSHNPAVVPDACLLGKNAGECGDGRRGLWWWWFNGEEGQCQKFMFYGCGGNDNRFYSQYYCRKICAEKLGPRTACDRCDLRASYCKANSKYNYTCECRDGFTKDEYGDCGDVDECRLYTASCHKNAWCVNTVGSYRCDCMAGYKGDGQQCAFVGLGKPTMDCYKCSPYATCNQGVCECQVGFVGDGFNCSDVNECLAEPYPCSKFAFCENTVGSYLCTCGHGFAGNGFYCTDSTKSCLDAFDRSYMEQCSGENWAERYYFDADQRRCLLFWYDGCNGSSANVFSTLRDCERMCEQSDVATRARICWDQFDVGYKNQCHDGRWNQRWYFDHASLTCRMFWYDQCRGTSRNMFTDLITCKWLCEVQPMYKTKSCLEEFDETYKLQCDGGMWRQYYYFDLINKVCRAFWYDGCTGDSENLFVDRRSCEKLCEEPASEGKGNTWEFEGPDMQTQDNGTTPAATTTTFASGRLRPWVAQKGGWKERVEDACRPSPCRNEGVCKRVRTPGDSADSAGKFKCECKHDYTGRICDKAPDDPCAWKPCKNGGVCVVKRRPRVRYVCECKEGFAGERCEKNPCDDNPCLNGGTCESTTGISGYVCRCPSKYSGKKCELGVKRAIKDGIDVPNYVGKLSSGTKKWVDRLRARKDITTPAPPTSPAPTTTSSNVTSASTTTDYDDDDEYDCGFLKAPCPPGVKRQLRNKTMRALANEEETAKQVLNDDATTDNATRLKLTIQRITGY